MNISVILAHPDKNSFNHALANQVIKSLEAQKHTIWFHDLYKENFDCILPAEEIPKDGVVPETVLHHCQEIQDADGIIIIHPNWWGMPPAILKGWVDRVIRPGVAYEFLETDSGEGIPNGLLKAQSAIVLNTSNTETQREQSLFKDPLQTIWKNCIFDLCGVDDFHRRMFNIIVTSTDEERKQWLQETESLVAKTFPGPGIK